MLSIQIKEVESQKEKIMLVGEFNGKVIGFVFGRVLDQKKLREIFLSVRKGIKFYENAGILLDKRFRNLGLGKEFMQRRGEHSQKSSASHYIVGTAKPKMKRMLEKQGFKPFIDSKEKPLYLNFVKKIRRK